MNFVLLKLPLFAPHCTGIANQMAICFVAKILIASWFARIASLIFWFHQDILLSLSLATLSRFRPQNSAADEMIADLNSSHSFLMSSDVSGSCLNLDDILVCSPKPLIGSYKPQKTCCIFCLAKVSKLARNILPDGDQLTVQHLASLKHPAQQKTNLKKLCKSLSKMFIHIRSILCTSILVNLSVLKQDIHDVQSVATTELQ